MVLSFLNCLIFILMLVGHIKERRRTEGCKVLLLKVKTMILFLIILLEISVFIRYTFTFDNTRIYDGILIISGFVESVVFFMICYFYTKKAVHFLEESKKIRKIMRIVMYASGLVFLILAIYQYWDPNVKDNSRAKLCKTMYFILPNCINQIANAFFIYIGFKVMKSINEFNSH